MHDQRAAEIGLVVRNAARCRSAELDEYQIEGYINALYQHEPKAVLRAFAILWRDVDNRNMPTPAAVIEKIHAEARTQQARNLLAPPAIPEDEHQFGLKCFSILQRMMRKEIKLQEAESEMDACAAEILCPDALARYRQACTEARP